MQGRHLQLRILARVYIPKNLAKNCYPKRKQVEQIKEGVVTDRPKGATHDRANGATKKRCF